MEDLVTMYQTFFFDLPLTGTKWGSGTRTEQEVTETVWKGYDAGVRLATAAINNLYRQPVVSEVVARSLGAMLRWQRLSNVLVGASFAGLWSATGLPTAAAVQGLRAEVQILREELRSAATDLRLAVSLQANGKLAPHPSVSLREERHSHAADLLVPGKEQAALTADLSEYFEPVADGTQSAPGSRHMKRAVLTTDLSEYFEPVAESPQLAPSSRQKVSNEGEAITKLGVRAEALQTEMPTIKRSLPPWPPYSRAGGQATNKKVAKGNTRR
jgi:hypothetical protein